MLKTFATLAIAAGLVVAPSAGADDYVTAKTLFGGGAIADRIPEATAGAAAQGFAIGLRHAPGSGSVGIRVAFVLSCSPYADGGGARAADVVTRAKVAGDGSFHLRGKRLKARGVGTLRLDVDGTIGKERADGTARIRTRYSCGGQVRPWTARGIETFDAVGLPGAPPADGPYYGVTDQDLAQGAVPHGVVAKVDDGGTSVHLFTSWTSRCRGRDRRGAYTAKFLYQGVMQDTPFGPTGFRRRLSVTETAAQHRRGVDLYILTQYQGGFFGPVLRGTLSDLVRYAEPGDRYKCRSGTKRFSAIA